MRSIFGWDLPPGVTQRMIDDASGHEGPLDCPVCNDGVEMDGPDCEKCANVTCTKHGCIVCQDLEKQRPMPPGYAEALAAEAKWGAEQEKLWAGGSRRSGGSAQERRNPVTIEARILKLDRPAASGEKWKALVVVEGYPVWSENAKTPWAAQKLVFRRFYSGLNLEGALYGTPFYAESGILIDDPPVNREPIS